MSRSQTPQPESKVQKPSNSIAVLQSSVGAAQSMQVELNSMRGHSSQALVEVFAHSDSTKLVHQKSSSVVSFTNKETSKAP